MLPMVRAQKLVGWRATSLALARESPPVGAVRLSIMGVRSGLRLLQMLRCNMRRDRASTPAQRESHGASKPMEPDQTCVRRGSLGKILNWIRGTACLAKVSDELNGDLCAHLHHTPGGNLEEVGGVVGR